MKRMRIVLLSINLFITLSCIIAFIHSGANVESLVSMLGHMEDFVNQQYLTSILIFTFGLTLAVFYSVPANPLFYLAAGYFFGSIEGAIVSACAVTLGSFAVYLFYRKVFSETNTESYRKFLPQNPTPLLVLLRLSPWFPAPLINLYCGVAKVPASTFISTTLCSSLPLVLCYTLISSELGQNFELSSVYSGWTGMALSLFGVLSLVGLCKPVKLGLELIRKAMQGLNRPALPGMGVGSTAYTM